MKLSLLEKTFLLSANLIFQTDELINYIQYKTNSRITENQAKAILNKLRDLNYINKKDDYYVKTGKLLLNKKCKQNIDFNNLMQSCDADFDLKQCKKEFTKICKQKISFELKYYVEGESLSAFETLFATFNKQHQL